MGIGSVSLHVARAREAGLRHAREILEDAIESLSEGFALYDRNDRLVLCNERFREYNEIAADRLASGTSWAAAGLLGQLWSTSPLTKLAKYGADLVFFRAS